MGKELRPCPFCGGEARLPTDMDGNPVNYECPDCICVNDSCPIVEYWVPVADWNTRPIEDTLTARIAELEAFIDKLIEAGDAVINAYPDWIREEDDWDAIVKDWKEGRDGNSKNNEYH